MKLKGLKFPGLPQKRPIQAQPKGNPIGTAFASAIEQKITSGNFSFSVNPDPVPNAPAQPHDESLLKLAAVMMGAQRMPQSQPAAELPKQPEAQALPEAQEQPTIHDRFADKKSRKRK